ncbi:hypothetical protein PT279_06595 [Bifidobacterium sp. ESL0784]|uniref:leucine-rich repeat domain-containing protein n=1 Tax=Bifidobacterium sp. ESL0784 TaxID=2983231 RepID=UPI0023F8416D|nr:leucine-rich repeat domain-containing protein [Bifidobacterium sp. ESL0784]MDF7641256.1 hypothetical protein [Bifidobacterium sp. ESL0784]
MRFSRKGVRRSLAACAAGVAAVAMLVPGSANAVETRGNCVVGTSTIAQCFPDTRLAADVAAKGGVAVGDVFTQQVADSVVLLRNHYVSLQGVQYLTNLGYLETANTTLSDLSPLAGLTQLTHLNVSYSSVSDISPLRGLTNLTTLALERDEITDISVLSGLTQLRDLSVDGNHIADLRPLKPFASRSDMINLYAPEQIPAMNPQPAATWLQTPRGLDGEYIRPTTITPSSGVFDPVTGVVSWTGLNEGDSIGFVADYHFPNQPPNMYNYDYNSFTTYSVSGPSVPSAAPTPSSTPAPSSVQKPVSGNPVSANVQQPKAAASGSLAETGTSVLGIAGMGALVMLLGAGLFMARRHA